MFVLVLAVHTRLLASLSRVQIAKGSLSVSEPQPPLLAVGTIDFSAATVQFRTYIRILMGKLQLSNRDMGHTGK